jgi:hypothetical protein
MPGKYGEYGRIGWNTLAPGCIATSGRDERV